MSSSQSWLSSYAYGGYSEKISRISALEIWQPYPLICYNAYHNFQADKSSVIVGLAHTGVSEVNVAPAAAEAAAGAMK